MTEEDAVRAALAAARRHALARAQALERDVAGIIAAAESVATDDEHDPEGATVAFERAQALALVEQARAHVRELDAALERLEAGGYGRCEICGRVIDPERLVARPAATTCITCASRRR